MRIKMLPRFSTADEELKIGHDCMYITKMYIKQSFIGVSKSRYQLSC